MRWLVTRSILSECGVHMEYSESANAKLLGPACSWKSSRDSQCGKSCDVSLLAQTHVLTRACRCVSLFDVCRQGVRISVDGKGNPFCRESFYGPAVLQPRRCLIAELRAQAGCRRRTQCAVRVDGAFSHGLRASLPVWCEEFHGQFLLHACETEVGGPQG